MRTYVVLLFLSILFSTSQIFAHPTYIGRSGAPGHNTCASSCHGNPGGTVSILNFPASYVPGQVYTITVKKASGDYIENFNLSIRVGTGNVNAGVIAAGSRTATYNTTDETNGVHLSATGQDTATFLWTAPAVGTGPVRLYYGAFQGTDPNLGFNSASVLVADEAVALPAVASNPSPANAATGVAVVAVLSWTTGSGATSHDVFFGTTNPPVSIGNQATVSYDPPGNLISNTTYYWRINERNAAGVTTGPVWSFVTINPPPAGRCCYPNNTCAMVTQSDCATLSGVWDAAATCASPCALDVPQSLTIKTTPSDAQLSWRPVVGAVGYRIHRASSIEALALPESILTTTTDTTFVDPGVLSLSDSRVYYSVEVYNP